MYACDNICCVRREEIAFFLCGRENVGKSFVDGAHAARVLADAPQCLGDDAVLVEDDVAVLADEFERERARDDAAAARDDVDVEMDDAVTPLLLHGGDASGLKLLAQEHDEGRGLGRILGSRLDEVRRGIARICIDIEQQVLSRLADAEDDGLLVRLVDLVDAPARESICELAHEGGHGEAVKAHRITFLFLYWMRKILGSTDKFGILHFISDSCTRQKIDAQAGDFHFISDFLGVLPSPHVVPIIIVWEECVPCAQLLFIL